MTATVRAISSARRASSPRQLRETKLLRSIRALRIVDREAHERFRDLVARIGRDPDALFVGHYVEFEWNRSRHFFESDLCAVDGKRVLEFGCNLGASAIILAMLGAHVTAIDVDENWIEIARANAERYGVADRITFIHVADSTWLPFGAGRFDLVTCNSVLEYVLPEKLREVQREIDRVLVKGGKVVVLGTSSRLWPRERHTMKWVNYVPRTLDRIMYGEHPRRGVTPWRIRFGFGNYDDVGARDRGRALLEIRSRMGLDRCAWRKRALSSITRALATLHLSLGMLMPSISLVLEKR